MPGYRTDAMKALDQVSQRAGLGQITQGYSEILSGLNHRGIGNPTPLNTDYHSMTFFTRPNLNLSSDNLAQENCLTTLLATRPDSYQAYVKSVLDHAGTLYRRDACEFINDKLPFITLLTNTLLRMSGWPPITVPTFTSSPGRKKEVWSMYDGTWEINDEYSLECTFRNIGGDPVSLLILTWIVWGSMAYEGDVLAHPNDINESNTPYTTRIITFKFDQSRRFITKWATTALLAFPRSLNLGDHFNVDMAQTRMEGIDDISVSFLCNGARYNQPLSLYEFNLLNKEFNPILSELDGIGSNITQTSSLVRIPHSMIQAFNYNGYPWINMDYMNELQWWLPIEQYQAKLNEINAVYSPVTP